MGGGLDPACQTLCGPLGCEAPCPDGGWHPQGWLPCALPGAGGTQDGVPCQALVVRHPGGGSSVLHPEGRVQRRNR